MKEITISFTNGTSMVYEGDVVIDPNVSVLVHNDDADLNVSINWNHILFVSVETFIDSDEEE
jgi:hypothetical protein